MVRELGNPLGNPLGLQRSETADSRGEITFAVPGTYTWTPPKGVTSVCVVCVGGGGGGGRSTSSYSFGGGGGALGWKNDIKVEYGKTYTVTVGAEGIPAKFDGSTWTVGTNGGDSYFESTSLVKGGGGLAAPISDSLYSGRYPAASSFVGDGGGAGGQSGNNWNGAAGGGGGGAGGYSGNGGSSEAFDGMSSTSLPIVAPTGGGGSAGGHYSVSNNSGGGGGVGLFGEGLSGSTTLVSGSGMGGSGGQNGGGASIQYIGGNGGSFGGGGGSGGYLTNTRTCTSGYGGHGGVRIIWGKGRYFPSTDCGQS